MINMYTHARTYEIRNIKRSDHIVDETKFLVQDVREPGSMVKPSEIYSSGLS